MGDTWPIIHSTILLLKKIRFGSPERWQKYEKCCPLHPDMYKKNTAKIQICDQPVQQEQKMESRRSSKGGQKSFTKKVTFEISLEG
jgi:hypothetical protein